ncbi:unnamed protein product [Calicophoron daubneyi]|uniref:Ferritin n=1 Tax=Calicophoron daubneyi TaxID=300641 RepID=A0AAV2T394_CALDB
MSSSLCRQFFHVECEAGTNKQINLELHASYVYMAMAYHFSRDDVALPGFHKFFLKQSEEEREHAQKLMKYQNSRGGRIVLQNIAPPESANWSSGLEAMEFALEMEKTVNKSLLELHTVAETHGDPQFTDFLEGDFLKEQVESIKQIADYVTNLRRVGPGLGEFLFDKEALHGEED